MSDIKIHSVIANNREILLWRLALTDYVEAWVVDWLKAAGLYQHLNRTTGVNWDPDKKTLSLDWSYSDIEMESPEVDPNDDDSVAKLESYMALRPGFTVVFAFGIMPLADIDKMVYTVCVNHREACGSADYVNHVVPIDEYDFPHWGESCLSRYLAKYDIPHENGIVAENLTQQTLLGALAAKIASFKQFVKRA